MTERKIHLAEQEARGLAMRQSVSLANSYAGQLQHVVDQMNHITLSVANAWQDSAKTVNLEQDQERGIFPSRFGFALFITDERGRVVKASFRLKEFVMVSGQSFFISHRDDCCLGMVISSVERSQSTGRSAVQFSRRINRLDGSFAGVVVITVAPEFLTSFQNEALPGNHDFVSARLVSGAVLATHTSGRSGSARAIKPNHSKSKSCCVFGQGRSVGCIAFATANTRSPRVASASACCSTIFSCSEER